MMTSRSGRTLTSRSSSSPKARTSDPGATRTGRSGRKQPKNGVPGSIDRAADDMRAPRFATFLCLAAVAGILLAWYGGHTPPASKEIVISGMVRDERGAVAGARVRMQRTPDNTLTDAQGRFQLTATAEPESRITSWKEGYFIGGAPADAAPLIIHLRPLPPNDCADYAWVSSDPDATKPLNCGNCHEEIHREWSASGHARSVNNRHFVNLYEGSDWQGHGNAGWSLLAEHPDGSGVCTSCHAPGLGFDDPAYYDLRKAA